MNRPTDRADRCVDAPTTPPVYLRKGFTKAITAGQFLGLVHRLLSARQAGCTEQREAQRMASPRTQNPVQYWQLHSRLTVEQAAHRIGISPDRYRAAVVFGKEPLHWRMRFNKSYPSRALLKINYERMSRDREEILETRPRVSWLYCALTHRQFRRQDRQEA